MVAVILARYFRAEPFELNFGIRCALPVLAAELITDAERYRKAVRIDAVATAVLYEGLYTMREMHRRAHFEARLAECRNQHSEHFER